MSTIQTNTISNHNEPNISNIKQGETYKNYKEMCTLLEVKQQAGNSRKAQLKDWERYFKYEKQGHKFIITHIYDTPLPKDDKRSSGNNAALYIDDIEKLILELLSQEQSSNGVIQLSKTKLLRELKMINDNYAYFRNKKIDLSDVMNIRIEEINDFYESSNSTFKSNLEAALNRLKRQALLYWTYAITVCYIDTRIETTETGQIKAVKEYTTNKNGEIEVKYGTVKPIQKLSYRKATAEEIKIINNTKNDLLHLYGCNDPSELYKTGKLNEFYDRLKDKLFEKTNIIFYYNSYEITFDKSYISKKLKEIGMTETKKERLQESLNNDIKIKLNENAMNRHIKAKENNVTFDKSVSVISQVKTLLRRSEKYLTNTEKLTDILIDKDMNEE